MNQRSDDSKVKLLRKIEELEPLLVKFLQELIRAKSVTGDEGREAQPLVKSMFEEIGLRTESWTLSKSEFGRFSGFVENEDFNRYRTNVVGLMGGRRGSTDAILTINGHIDVVPAGTEWKHDPYGGDLRDGKIFGRGSCDMKGGLAAAIFAARALVESGVYDNLAEDSSRPGLMIQSVCGEEKGGVGTLSAILRGYAGDENIIAEPSNLDIVAAQCGCADFKITVEGKAAHGANRNYGVSAFEKFIPVFNALLDLEAKRKKAKNLPLYKNIENVVPLSVGKVSAGDWNSTVPEELVAEGRYGVWPGETLEHARREFEAAISRVSKSDTWLSKHLPKIEWVKPDWESAEISVDSKLVRDLVRTYKFAEKKNPVIAGETAGTDMRFFTNLVRKPALILGPGDIRLAHFRDEYVSVDQVVRACKIFALFGLSRISQGSGKS